MLPRFDFVAKSGIILHRSSTIHQPFIQQVLWSLLWQVQAVFNFLGRFQGHMVRGCWKALNHASIVPVTKHRQLAHLKTTFNDEKFFLIATKEITLKMFIKLRLQPQKNNSVSFTYRRRSTQNYCVLRDQTIFLYNSLLCLPKAFRGSCLSL